MHIPKTLNAVIAQGMSVGALASVHQRMRMAITFYLERKFEKVVREAAGKPLGPVELQALLSEILYGSE